MAALSIRQIIGIVAVSILIIGVGVGVYLVQRQQTLKSRAAGGPGNFVTAFELQDASGSAIPCDTSKDPPECTIARPAASPWLDIKVRVATTTPLLP